MSQLIILTLECKRHRAHLTGLFLWQGHHVSVIPVWFPSLRIPQTVFLVGVVESGGRECFFSEGKNNYPTKCSNGWRVNWLSMLPTSSSLKHTLHYTFSNMSLLSNSLWQKGAVGKKKQKAPFIFPMFFILQGAFLSHSTQKRDLHAWSCAVLTGLLLEYELGSQRWGVSVCLCTHVLWWVPITPAVWSSPTHCQTYTDRHTLLICSLLVLKADKCVVILQVKDKP